MSAAVLLGAVSGCELILPFDEGQLTGGGGTGGATATITGGTTTSGGATGGTTSPPKCEKADDCPDPDNECLSRACINEKCMPVFVASNTPVAAQTKGDCLVVVCDGNGANKSTNDDTDVPVDGKECTDDNCNGGVPSNLNVAPGQACGANGALYCDDNGVCVGCSNDGQCGTATDCVTPTCGAGSCTTLFTTPGTPISMQNEGDCKEVQCDGIGGMKSVDMPSDITDDGNPCTFDVCNSGAATHPFSPTGTSCSASGGTQCNGAGTCVECIQGADCASGVCVQQTCAAPSCMDGVKNGPEADVDCGSMCPVCANGKHCNAATDCANKVCIGNICLAASCSDTVKNGTETDVDCGGSCAAKCGPGLTCNLNADCKGAFCTGNTCVPTCTDTVKNGTETDIDCGGSCATKCAAGKMCIQNSDCVFNTCTGNICAGDPCSDGIKNQGETDVDCGGPNCSGCAPGKTCIGNTDCASSLCTAGVCGLSDVEPTNNTCAGASFEPLPLNGLSGLSLPTTADVDWFVFTAAAGDVGKVVHVVTGNVGAGNACDTVVEVFRGTCASLTSLGGPSNDQDYAENWLSTPLTSAGSFWVKVSYSAFGFSKAPYTLTVTLQ